MTHEYIWLAGTTWRYYLEPNHNGNDFWRYLEDIVGYINIGLMMISRAEIFLLVIGKLLALPIGFWSIYFFKPFFKKKKYLSFLLVQDL